MPDLPFPAFSETPVPHGGRKTLDQRFRNKVRLDKETGCIVWTGGASGVGYGQISVGGRMRAAHRVAYELVNGPIPDGAVIRHSCNNTLCVNPLHLLPGTQQDNVNDMIAAGRAPKNAGRKLTDRDVCIVWGLRILGHLQKDIVRNAVFPWGLSKAF